MGRPKKKEPKCKSLRIRLTKEEYAFLKATAEEVNCSMSALLIHGFWEILRRFPEQDTSIIIEKARAMM